MDVHAFIFNWKGHFDRACRLESQISKLVRTTVINSDESRAAIRKKWCHLGDDAYFAAQWNKALELFQGDLLLHVQADASIKDAQLLIERATNVMKKYNVAVFEPIIDYTAITYERERLHALAPKLMVVPRTDCTCWFIRGEVLRYFQPVNVAVNKYGWGVDLVAAAYCRLTGALCVRDYSVKVQHPKSRGYSTQAAWEQMNSYFQTLDPTVANTVMYLHRECLMLGKP